MKYFLFVPFFMLSLTVAKAQTKALTETGRQVTLYDNGTWKYADSTTIAADTIVVNHGKFVKSVKQSFPVKSNITNAGVYIDPAKWTVQAHKPNQTQEYQLTAKSGNGMAIMMAEKTEIGIEHMGEVALLNARKADANARITRQEYREVNGHKVLYVEMSATIAGIKLKYMSYYFSNQTGTTQLVSFTSEQLYKQAYVELSEFLNGLSVF